MLCFFKDPLFSLSDAERRPFLREPWASPDLLVDSRMNITTAKCLKQSRKTASFQALPQPFLDAAFTGSLVMGRSGSLLAASLPAPIRAVPFYSSWYSSWLRCDVTEPILPATTFLWSCLIILLQASFETYLKFG